MKKKEKAVSVQRWRVGADSLVTNLIHYEAPQAQARPERFVLHRLKLEEAPQAYKTVSTMWN